MKKNLLAILMLIVVGLLIYYFTQWSSNKTNEADSVNEVVVDDGENKKITIAMVTFPGYAPLYLAEEKNLRPDWYDVELVRIESLGDIRTAMKAGKIDMYAGTYDMFLATEWNEPVGKGILALDESTWWDGVAVVGWIDSLTDLVGSDVTAEAWLPPHFLLMYALYQEWLSLDDVNLQDVPSSDAAAAFIAKQADIVGTYEPYLSNAVASRDGSEILLSSADTPWLIVDLLRASDDMIADKTGVSAVVEWWYEALMYLESNADESYAIMGESFGVDAEEMKWFHEGVKRLNQKDNENLFSDNNEFSAYTNYELVQNILKKNGVNLYPTDAKNKLLWDFISIN